MTQETIIQLAKLLGLAPEYLPGLMWSAIFFCAGAGILCVAAIGLQFFPAGDGE
jgi:hypothetical protein